WIVVATVFTSYSPIIRRLALAIHRCFAAASTAIAGTAARWMRESNVVKWDFGSYTAPENPRIEK
ncbi:hypothetical protein HAX54_027519, partial [Datura stramonium]|nr:hypothetical protein [Datura stramonium]